MKLKLILSKEIFYFNLRVLIISCFGVSLKSSLTAFLATFVVSSLLLFDLFEAVIEIGSCTLQLSFIGLLKFGSFLLITVVTIIIAI